MTLLSKHTIDKITAEQLLAITHGEPERLFSARDKKIVKQEYRKLARQWHPDRNKHAQAADVMSHLANLYEKANQKIDTNTWEVPNVFMFQTLDGKKKKISYLKKAPFELGTMYIADTMVAFAVNKTETDLYCNAKDILSSFKYPDGAMRDKMAHVLPQIKHQFETADKLVMVVGKDADDILLSDVLHHMHGKIDPVHTAWIVSRLHNIGCYLEWAGLTHNAISADTCFISPKNHNLSLLGGWWYAAKQGSKLKALPPKTASVVSPTLFDNPVADKRVDLSLIRATGREILGDIRGLSLIGSKEIPKPMLSWMNGVSSGDAQKDYGIWMQQVLQESFGARRFVEMNITPNDIYQPV